MVLLQPRLHLKVSQRQILTPGLVQMVSVLALNKLELKDMITAEMVENPVLEELEDTVPLIDDVGRREAAEVVIGNLNEDGYLIASDEELLGVTPAAPPEVDAAKSENVVKEAAALGLAALANEQMSAEQIEDGTNSTPSEIWNGSGVS